MKFTVIFVGLFSISWAVKVRPEDPKDKREAQVGYHGSGESLHSYQAPSFHSQAPSFHGQAPSFGHGDANAISIGAGYSIGGAKPQFVYGSPEEGHQLQLQSEGLPSSGHATIQLQPITLQPSHGGIASSDLSQLMQELSQSLNSGALQLGPYQGEGHSGVHGGQEFAIQQYLSGDQKQQYSLPEQSYSAIPSYAAGTKGLGSYGSTGPVLFTPENHGQAAVSLGSPSSGGHSFEGSSLTFSPGSLSGLQFAEGEHGLSLGGHSLGGGSGISLGHSFGGSIKSIGGSFGHGAPSKASFKPSAYLGSSDAGHGSSGSSGSHAFHGGLSLGSGYKPSFGSSHGFGGGSAKFISPSYLPPKSKGFGSSHDSVAAFSHSGHASPPRTTYGHPAGSFSGSLGSSLHSSSSHSPKYYVSSSKFPSFEGGSSFKGSPSSLTSLSSSGSKYSFGSRSGPSLHYGAPKDAEGSYSENTYNTIKYSEELKPRAP